MRRFVAAIAPVAILLIMSAGVLFSAESTPVNETQGLPKGNYAVELVGLGFAFQNSDLTYPQAVMIKIISARYLSDTFTYSSPLPESGHPSIIESSALRLGYHTYPLDVIELSINYLEADIYSAEVGEAEKLTYGEPVGKLEITRTLYTGLAGGKGTITLGGETYHIVFYEDKAFTGLDRWAPELE